MKYTKLNLPTQCVYTQWRSQELERGVSRFVKTGAKCPVKFFEVTPTSGDMPT